MVATQGAKRCILGIGDTPRRRFCGQDHGLRVHTDASGPRDDLVEAFLRAVQPPHARASSGRRYSASLGSLHERLAGRERDVITVLSQSSVLSRLLFATSDMIYP